ncbi:RNA polymerase II transcription factor-like protein B subunit 3 [Calycina marina]|uniref:RNA polymerase II transcription factor B subunit 3 n=1 Tax=Calycina marina TaxID=1763456 RepID=A0A9P7Z3M1_9HELO|nr:RNA polymerase II transcription factor-like protein B subunit 3 [Calycina marina]
MNSLAMSRLNINSKHGEDPSNDICPVCKSNRYLNPSLQFLINPECYHKMCSTCVDRIFTSGPAACPVPHCGKTLRKKGFHKAFFESLSIEREVDIRRKVASVFNRRQEEFESLRLFNDYLEDVENLVFDLVEGRGKVRQAAEKKLEQYRLGNMKEIEENERTEKEEAEMEKLRETNQKEAARRRRLANQQEELEEKAVVAKAARDTLEQLANDEGHAEEITKRAERIILKGAGPRRRQFEKPVEANGSADGSLTIRGLKKKEAPTKDMPYDPFGGLNVAPTKYVLQKDYESQWLAGVKKNENNHLTGGYSLPEYYGRAMFEAFSGLSVFIEDEKEADPKQSPSAAVATEAAVLAVGVMMEIDDVF